MKKEKKEGKTTSGKCFHELSYEFFMLTGKKKKQDCKKSIARESLRPSRIVELFFPFKVWI